MTVPSSIKPKLLYVISPSFSGSTLLSLLIAQHASVATIGELKATALGPIDDYDCSCGARIRDCSFWNELQEELGSATGSFDLANLGTHFASSLPAFDRVVRAQVRPLGFEAVRRALIKLVPSWSKAFSAILDRNYAFVRSVLKLQGGDVFLDGSKDPQRLLYLQQSDRFDLSVLQITRDGRAQCHSQRIKDGWDGGFATATKEWSGAMRQISQVLDTVKAAGVPFHQIQYEALCEDPNKTMISIFEFMHLPQLPIDWSDVTIQSESNHLLGNSMRTKTNIRLKLDERWKTSVSENELQLFEKRCGAINRQLGYQGNV